MQTWRIHRLLNIARDVDLSRFIKFSTPTRKARAREFHETRTKARASAHCLRNIYHRCIIQRGRIFAFEQSSIRSNFNEIEQPGQKCREIMALSWLIGSIILPFFPTLSFCISLPEFEATIIMIISSSSFSSYYSSCWILLFDSFWNSQTSDQRFISSTLTIESLEWSWNSIKISPFFLIG